MQISPEARPSLELARNGKTCGDCLHCVPELTTRTHRCGLMVEKWTRNKATEIKKKDAACIKFRSK